MPAQTPVKQRTISKALFLLLAEMVVAALVLAYTVNVTLLLVCTAVISLTAGYWLAGLRPNQAATATPGITQPPSECSAALNLATGFFTEEITGIEQETVRVRTLVTDAAQQLSQSFHSLAEQTALSGNLVKEVLDRSHKTFANSSGKNEQSFIDETGIALDQFIQILVLVSKQSLRTVYEIDDMVKHVDSIFALLDDVRHIADQTNFLSLNAAIEAARAGDAGRGFSVVASEIRNLSDHSNELNTRIRAEIENTKKAIANVRATVGDMAARDMTTAIHTKDRLNETFEDFAEFNTYIAGHISQLSNITQQINSALGDSVRSLQFEDIVTQALHQTEYHVATLNELNTRLSTIAVNNADNEKVCNALQDALTAYAAQRQVERSRKVEQESMKEGGIDLF